MRIDLNDRDLANGALTLIRSIADKWEEFRDDAIQERNRYRDNEVRRLRLEAEQKAASTTTSSDIV